MSDKKLLQQIAETQFEQRRADDWEYRAGQRGMAVVGLAGVIIAHIIFWWVA